MPSASMPLNEGELLESSLRFDIRYAGVIADIPVDLDLTGRTDFLTSVDRAQNDGYKIYDPERIVDAILVLNPYSIWILEKRSEDLAETICANLERCFQLVFGEATSQFFDKTITEGANTNLSLSGSRANLSKRVVRSQPQNSSTTHSESDQLSADAADLIQEYIRMLHATLSNEELKQFAILLKRWRADNLPFSEFFQKVLELYGSERKYLLASMPTAAYIVSQVLVPYN
ncbi:unnamed protein product [Soboliphyme baturini]|uniref:CCM2_C domain-containing protein n=1 Tax=Soboliphyme baturini TaxID=241478 RepID=A0A183IEG6_9BILA|nr:unnamed protein product [Soboliphyme baturini]